MIDNCILSSLAKINRIDLLEYLDHPITSSSTVEEIFRSEIDLLIKTVSEASNRYLEIKTIEKPQKILELQNIHPALSYVDCELILLCVENNCALLSDDGILLSIVQNNFQLLAFDLCDFLLSLMAHNIIDCNEMEKIILDLENKDHYRFSKEELKLLRE